LFLYSTIYLMMPNNEHIATEYGKTDFITNCLYVHSKLCCLGKQWVNCLCSPLPCHEHTHLTCTQEVPGSNPSLYTSYPYCSLPQ
jgi:hypothetical protein